MSTPTMTLRKVRRAGAGDQAVFAVPPGVRDVDAIAAGELVAVRRRSGWWRWDAELGDFTRCKPAEARRYGNMRSWGVVP